MTVKAILSYREIIDAGTIPGVAKAEIDTCRHNKYWTVYPHKPAIRWNWDNLGPLWIPKKGVTIMLDSIAFFKYADVIAKHENAKIEKSPHGYLVNGKPARKYTFQKDYCFVMGDNRYDSLDSRYFGFVPLHNVIGKACWIIYSDKGGLFAVRSVPKQKKN